MGQNVFVDCDLIIMLNKLVVLLVEGDENKGKALGVDMDVVESFHHFLAWFHEISQGNFQAFNGFFDRQGAGMDSRSGQLRYQFLPGLGGRDVTCQPRKSWGRILKAGIQNRKGISSQPFCTALGRLAMRTKSA